MNAAPPPDPGSGGSLRLRLLAGTLLTPGLRLWTRDRRLHAVAEEIGLASSPGVY